MLPQGIPERTLGWQALQWASENLVNPDTKPGIHIKGDQWVFQPDQALFILWFYAVDENGDWLYRRAYRERAKGTGKSPMVAAIACIEFLGPAMFSHFDESGQPIATQNPNSVIWITGISRDSCKHTYKYVMGMLDGPARYRYNLDVGMTRVLVRGQRENKIIETITASDRSHEGPQPTFVIMEETQNWIPSQVGLFEDTIARGLGKTDGRRIEVTNAPEPGLDSVAEDTHKYQQMIDEGEAEETGLLFDTFSIHIKDLEDKPEVMAGLDVMYAHAPWIKKERIWREIQDPSTREVDARRFYFNEMIPPNEMWISGTDWDKAKVDRLQLNRKDPIAVGFRIRKHCCSLVATRLRDAAVFSLKTWERPRVDAPRDWEVPYGEIGDYVHKLFRTHNVKYFMSSPNGFADVIGRWAIQYQDITFEGIWLDRNKQKHADAVDVFESAVRDQRIKHSGDETLKRHVMNCFVNEVPQGRLIRMETYQSKEYIVAAEAAVLSFQGALEAIADGGLDDPPDNYLYGF